MTGRAMIRSALWIAAALALAFAALMAWFALTTFGPPDTQTFLIRMSFVGAFILAAILAEWAFRAQTSERKYVFLSAIVMIALLEFLSVVWVNR